MPTAITPTTVSPPRVLLMTSRIFPTVQEAVMRAGAARGWRMRMGYTVIDALPAQENYEGILLMGRTPEIVAWAAGASCPVVRIFDALENNGRFPVVDTDDRAIGRMGARHFLELGYANLVFFRNLDVPGSAIRRDHFVEEAVRAGRVPVVLEVSSYPNTEREVVRSGRDQRERWLAEKLAHLPKPLAIMPDEELFAPEIVHAARLSGLRVPEDVAVLAPNNFLSEHLAASPVSLSFISGNKGPGDVAVGLLADLMAGQPAPSQPILLAPTGVTVHASTAFFVSDVSGITETVLFIRAHFRERLRVDMLAQRVGMSLRKLQSEFKKAVGCTISEEVFRLRMQLAERMLRETDMKLSAVATETGFGGITAFYRAFASHHAMTPGEYRQASGRGMVEPTPKASPLGAS